MGFSARQKGRTELLYLPITMLASLEMLPIFGISPQKGFPLTYGAISKWAAGRVGTHHAN